MVREGAADERAEDAGGGEDGRHEAGPASAFGWREDVAQDREGDAHDHPRAEPLDHAEGDKLLHVLRGAGERRAEEQKEDAAHVKWLAAVNVGELAEDGNG